VIIGKSAIAVGEPGNLIKELLKYSFVDLRADKVELKLYDENMACIKCYKKAGFTINPAKQQVANSEG